MIDRINTLLNTTTETEFFIVLSGLLKRLGGLPFQIAITRYSDESALKIPFQQMVERITPDARIFGAEQTHTFILTQSGTLVWMIHGDKEETIIGLAGIQARMRQVTEDSRQPLMFVEQSASPDAEKAAGHARKGTKPTLEFTIPRQTDNPKKKAD